MPSTAPPGAPQPQIAVFIDFENIALGLRGAEDTFDIGRVLDRLLEKGKVIVKVAYADWHRFRGYTQVLHEHGIELVEIPRRALTGKNSADIRLCVDALDLSWSKEHIDTFVILSGDSDFSPLVSKLKENGRRVIGLGMRASTSPLLANACDEFIYYENLDDARHGPGADADRIPEGKDEAFRLLLDTVRALEREGVVSPQASLVKDTMKRKRPAFSEGGLGYGSFSELLEDASEAGLVTLRKDERSGTYAVEAAGRQRSRGPRSSERASARSAAPHASERAPARTAAPRPSERAPARAAAPRAVPSRPEPVERNGDDVEEIGAGPGKIARRSRRGGRSRR